MKFLLTSALLASTTLGSVVPRAGQKVDYNGFKALRITLPEGSESVKAQVEDLVAHVLNPGKSAELDVVVAPQDVEALNALVGESKVIAEDVGAVLADEGEVSTYAGALIPEHHQAVYTNFPQCHRNRGSPLTTHTPTTFSSCETCRPATPATLLSSQPELPSKAAPLPVSRSGEVEAADPSQRSSSMATSMLANGSHP
jgi:hypothetical protein